jgi:CRP/FNR family transcriptional regulator, cyclic AMP receptor protein
MAAEKQADNGRSMPEQPRMPDMKGKLRRRRLLDADPSLAGWIPEKDRASLNEGIAPVIASLAVGTWDPPRSEPEPGHLGYLIVDGLLIRELFVAGARSVELLGRGDLLRPWDEDAASFVQARWVVHQTVELAVFDRAVVERICRWPELVAALSERAMRRSRSLAVHAAIEGIRGLDTRLLTLFWHLAERWGKRTEGGILIPLDLTHQNLSDLVAARRPSVTTALGSLREQGLVERAQEGWILRGDPPDARPD